MLKLQDRENNECAICGSTTVPLSYRDPHPSDEDRRRIYIYWCTCCNSFPEKRV